MVALVLGLLLSAGIINIYAESKRNFSNEEEAARMQENGRYALGLLKRELTLAGFMGGASNPEQLDTAVAIGGTDCSSLWALDAKYQVPATSPPVYEKNAIDLVNNYSSSLTSVLNVSFSGCITAADVQSGTDIVSVKRTAGDFTLRNGVFNTSITAAATNQWYLRYVPDFSDASWVYLGGSGVIPSAEVGTNTGIDYWQYSAKVFYIQSYSSASGDGVPTLCSEALVGANMQKECLVEGIEDMQIEFGVDSDGDGVPNRFETAPDADELVNSVAARIYLLVRSVNTAAGHTDNKAYVLGAKNVAAKNDGFLRKVFSTSVQLRNSVIPSV